MFTFFRGVFGKAGKAKSLSYPEWLRLLSCMASLLSNMLVESNKRAMLVIIVATNMSSPLNNLMCGSINLGYLLQTYT